MSQNLIHIETSEVKMQLDNIRHIKIDISISGLSLLNIQEI